jgi:hypothetical protein
VTLFACAAATVSYLGLAKEHDECNTVGQAVRLQGKKHYATKLHQRNLDQDALQSYKPPAQSPRRTTCVPIGYVHTWLKAPHPVRFVILMRTAFLNVSIESSLYPLVV